ncbi:hypothetical protein AB0H73_09520 [Streptomyces olivoreticuli]
MTPITWLRAAGDRLVRAERIAEINLWGPGPAAADTVVASAPARIVVRLDTPAGEWVEAARIARAEHGGELIKTLCSRLAAAASRGTDLRYIYGLYVNGELVGWSDGPAIPDTDSRVPPLHFVAADEAPGMWLASRSRTSRAQDRLTELVATPQGPYPARHRV